MKTKLIMTGLLAMLLVLTGCNTVQGFGKDMQAGGQNLQKAADDNK